MKNLNYLAAFDFDEIFDAFSDSFSTMYSKVGNVKHSFSKDEENFYIEMTLPSYKKDEINIDFENGILTVSSDISEGNWKEEFKKVFKIKQIIDSDNIKANLVDGILKIVLPKTEQSKSKKIKIE